MKFLIFLGVVVHIVLLACIFHVYYTSPIEHVADGLRAQSFFDESHKRAPYLASIIHSPTSVWGVSHTAVPTESRPGHVAMAAGFTEDVSSVTKGWSENAVEFDTVFNRSSMTYAWGSPDIVPMFARGVTDGHVRTESYSPEEEDFASANASHLDTWVFDRVDRFLAGAHKTSNPSLFRPGVILFLHLLGTDTNGHAHKPHSEQYLGNMAVIDAGVRKLVERMEEVFADGRTSYLFTSDHGMTDWGAHGAGTTHETYTPVLIWGAGQHSTQWRHTADEEMESVAMLDDGWWHAHHQRQDMQQIDLAPLMSSLLGCGVPTNNLGVVHLAYLRSASVKYKFHAAHANFRQLHAIYDAKRANIEKNSFRWAFRDYAEVDAKRLTSISVEIDRLSSEKRFAVATQLCEETMPHFVDAAFYFHRYDRPMQTVCIVLMIWAWIVVLLVYQSNFQSPSPTAYYRPSLIGQSLTVTLLLLLYVQRFTWPNYVYVLMPVLLADYARSMLIGRRIFSTLRNTPVSTYVELLLLLLAPLLFAQIYTHRSILSACLCLLAAWPTLSQSARGIIPLKLRLTWTFLCLLNAVFPLLPTIGQSKSPTWFLLLPLVLLALIVVGWPTVTRLLERSDVIGQQTVQHSVLTTKMRYTFAISAILTTVALLYGNHQLSSGNGVPYVVWMFAWAALVILPVYSVAVLDESRVVATRCLHVLLGLVPAYTLLSLSHEMYFLLAFTALLTVWTVMEMYITDGAITVAQRCALVRFGDGVKADMITGFSDTSATRRRACIYVLFALHAFFGTGNMASVNSFDPSMVRLFATVFAPFLMMALLIVKLLVPQLMLAVAMQAQHRLLVKADRSDILHVNVLLVADLITMVCFFHLRDSGSWLDIGQSISHYVLSVLLTLALMLLKLVAWYCVNVKIRPSFKRSTSKVSARHEAP